MLDLILQLKETNCNLSKRTNNTYFITKICLRALVRSDHDCSRYGCTDYDCRQKQPVRVVLRKRCSENMQQIYRRTPMPNCDFNKVAFQLY